MNKTVSAIYEAGSLQLLEPLELPDATRVQVQVSNSLFENGYRQDDSYQRCLANLRALLNKTEAHWAMDLVRESFPRILRNELHTLWSLSEPPQRKLCAMLQLSAKQLDEARVTLAQLALLRTGITLLEQDDLPELALKSYRRQLIEAGLPPRFTLEDAVVQRYVDEL